MRRKSQGTGEDKKGQVTSPKAVAVEEVSRCWIGSRHCCLDCWPGKAPSSQTGSPATVTPNTNKCLEECAIENRFPCSVHISWRAGLSHKTAKMCVCVCLCMVTHTHARVCELTANLQCYSSPQEPSPCVSETGSLPGTQSSPIRIHWLAREPHGSACLKCVPPHLFFYVCSGYHLTKPFLQPKSMSSLSCVYQHSLCMSSLYEPSSVGTRLLSVLQWKCDHCDPSSLGFQGKKKGEIFHFRYHSSLEAVGWDANK